MYVIKKVENIHLLLPSYPIKNIMNDFCLFNSEPTNFSNFSNYFITKYTKYRCTICHNIPFIWFSDNNIKQINIKCQNCNSQKVVSIDSYYQLITNKKKLNSKCTVVLNHSNKKAKYYCIDCVQFLCDTCYKSHSIWNKVHSIEKLDAPINNNLIIDNYYYDYNWLIEENQINTNNDSYTYFCKDCKMHFNPINFYSHYTHNYIELLKYFTNKDFSDIEVDVNKKKEENNEIISNLYKKTTDYLKEQMQKIKEAYEKNRELAKMIITFFKALLESYNQNIPNYYTIKSILNIKKCKLFTLENYNYKDTSQSNINKLIDFFQRDIIYIDEKKSYLENFESIAEINHSEGEIFTLHLLKNSKLALCSNSTNVFIYNLDNYKLEHSLKGHMQQVTYISDLANGNLISSSKDNTIRLWEIETYKCIQTINAHNGEVGKVISLTNKRIATCSEDKTIKIWQSEEPYKLISTLIGSNGRIVCIFKISNEETIVSGATTDCCLRFWDIIQYKMKAQIENVKCCFTNGLIQINNNVLAVGSYAGVVLVDFVKYIVVKRIQNIDDYIASFVLLEKEILLCGSNRRLLILDIKKGVIVDKKENCHMNNIGGLLKLREGFIISCSFDRKVKIWKY